MTPSARVSAAITVLDRVLAGEAAEKALIGWARGARYAGSGDRAAVRDFVFDALRAMRSLAARGGAMTGRGLMIGLIRRDGADLAAMFDGVGYGSATVRADEAGRAPLTPAEAGDLPDWLYPLFNDALGVDCDPVLTAMQTRAPMFLRVNLRRTDRAAAQQALAADGIATQLHPNVNTALEVTDNPRKVSVSAAYLSGLVDVQDAASQAAVLALPLQAGQRVLDYCAGGGGKALAVVDRENVRVMAHDIAPERMADLPARSARAGVEIGVMTVDPAVDGPFDLVICDAPCSGSGTWRRSPDAKWRLTGDGLAQYVATQGKIIDAAAACVGPAGTLAYMTCSVLNAENNVQIDGFVGRNPGWRVDTVRQWLPGPMGDGFFLAILRRTTRQP